jgi:hypothetical protein
MKRHFNPKFVLVLLVFCSILSAAYLEFNGPINEVMSGQQSLVENYIKEKAYLPEVKFIKEVLKTIFNVVNA